MYSSRAWFEATEAHPVLEPLYLVARLGGAPAAILPTYFGSSIAPRYDPGAELAGLGGPFARQEAWFPGLVGGTRSGYRTELIVDPGLSPPERAAVLAALADAFVDLAREREAAAAWLMYLGTADAVELGPHLVSRGAFPVLTAADLWLDVEWDSFEGYLASLSAGRRSAARRELRRFEAGGGAIELGDLSPWSELGPLFYETQHKYARGTTAEWAREHLRRQAAALGDVALVCSARRNGARTGFALFYRSPAALCARLVGFDYARSAPGDYFVVLFYEPIRHAIEQGFRAVQLGTGSYAQKIARGAEPRPLWSWVFPPAGAEPPGAGELADWNSRRIDGLLAEFGPAAQERRADWEGEAERVLLASA